MGFKSIELKENKNSHLLTPKYKVGKISQLSTWPRKYYKEAVIPAIKKKKNQIGTLKKLH